MIRILAFCIFTLYSFGVNNLSLAQNLAEEFIQQKNSENYAFNQKRNLREIFFKDSKVFYCQKKNRDGSLFGYYLFFYEKRTDLPSNIGYLLLPQNSFISGEIVYGKYQDDIIVNSPQDVPNYLIHGLDDGFYGNIKYPEYLTQNQKARMTQIKLEREKLRTQFARTRQESLLSLIDKKDSQMDKLWFDFFLENKVLDIPSSAHAAKLNGSIITVVLNRMGGVRIQLDINNPIIYAKVNGGVHKSDECKLIKDNGIKASTKN
jgi:hypothetical protein